MDTFDKLLTDFSSKNIENLLQNRKILLNQLLQRRLRINSLSAANLKKALAAIKEVSPQHKYSLRISRCHGCIQYYLVPLGIKGKPVYLPKKHEQIAKIIAQHNYNLNLIVQIQKEIASLEKMERQYKPAINLCAENKSEAAGAKTRAALVTPALLSAEKFAAEWQKIPVPQNPRNPENLIFKTNRGEHVRSKSELMIANELYRFGIPYRYEAPLVLRDGSRKITFHPDFILLDKATRREIIWEHFGLMDNSQYCNSAIEKMALYRKNGISGARLIFTMENNDCPLTLNKVGQIIRKLK